MALSNDMYVTYISFFLVKLNYVFKWRYGKCVQRFVKKCQKPSVRT
jgi:hypothetical protein